MHIPLLSRLLRRSKGDSPFELRLVASATPHVPNADTVEVSPFVPLSETSAWTRFEVPAHAFCHVSGRLAGRKLADARAAMLRVRFLDAEATPLQYKETDDLSYNAKHGLHCYPAAGAEKLPHGFGRGFHAPEAARYIEIQLHWPQGRAGSAFVSKRVDVQVWARPAMAVRTTAAARHADLAKAQEDLRVPQGDATPIPITRRSNWASMPVVAGRQYVISLRMEHYAACLPDSIVGRFAFFDAQGNAIPGRRTGFSHSDRAGLYRYVNADSLSDGLVAEFFTAPPGATRLDFTMQAWRHDAALPVMWPFMLLTPLASRPAQDRAESAPPPATDEPLAAAQASTPAPRQADAAPAHAPLPAPTPVAAEPVRIEGDSDESRTASYLRAHALLGGKEAMARLEQSGLSAADQAVVLTQAARSLAEASPAEALMLARRAHACYQTPTRQKWLAFLLYDHGDVEEAYALLKTVPAKLLSKASEQTKAKRIARAAAQARQARAATLSAPAKLAAPPAAAAPSTPPSDAADAPSPGGLLATGFPPLPPAAPGPFAPPYQGCPAIPVPVQGKKAGNDRIALDDKGTPLHFPWEDGASYSLSGHIFCDEAGTKAPALLRFDMESPLDPDALKVACGLSHSPSIGLYLYLRPAKGSAQFSVLFKIPRHSKLLGVHIRRWDKSNAATVSSTLTLHTLGRDLLLDDAASARIGEAFQAGGAQAAQHVIDAQFPLPQARADAYEHLAALALAESYACSQETVRQAHSLDPSVARTKRLAGFATEHGMSRLVAELAGSLAGRQCLSPQEEIWHRRAVSQRSLLETLSSFVPERAQPRHTVHPGKSLYVAYFSLPHHSNGYATRTHGLLSALQHSDREYIVATRPGYPFDGKSKHPSLPYDQVDEVIYRRLSGPDIIKQGVEDYLQSAAAAIEAVALSHGVSVIHCASNWRIGLPSLMAARRLGLPFVYEVRGLWELTKASKTTRYDWKETDQYRLDSEAERLLFQHADHVMPITDRLGQEVVKSGARADQITVCPNSIDVSLFNDRPADKGLRLRLGLKYPITIGFVGSFAYYEGLDDLVQACRHLVLQGYRFNVLLVGDGDALATVRDMVAEYRLEDYFHLTGRIPFEDVPAYYSLIDICPFPRKPFEVCEIVSPLKPFEAMAMKKAVVASDVAALTEIVQHGHTGLLFEKGNPKDLAARLKELIKDGLLRRNLGAQAQAWVTAERTWTKAAEVLNDVHWKVAGHKAAPKV
ncbi:Glycosyl transferase, group 1 [plant metagenome]|uniref:Glycosyl transferase, group 1 n=1 Tax=plant metagenome TaxID=1297885 RepID=A0A484SHE5_9ZZZZ